MTTEPVMRGYSVEWSVIMRQPQALIFWTKYTSKYTTKFKLLIIFDIIILLFHA